MGAIGQLPKYADIVIGGFPCQDISINGKMAGDQRQAKQPLFGNSRDC